jgi:uncharacterized protein YecT (DUF1311 family)
VRKALLTILGVVSILSACSQKTGDENYKESLFYDRDGKKPGRDLFLIAEGGGQTEYLLISSIKKIDETNRLYESIIDLHDKSSEALARRNNIGSILYENIADCNKKRSKRLAANAFVEVMAKGTSFHAEPAKEDWQEQQKDTVGRRALDFICAQSVKEASENSQLNRQAISESAPAPAPVEVSDNSAFSPSFDCAKASSGPEKLVCSERELAKLDVELSQAYMRVMETTSDKDALRKAQRVWLRQSFGACSDKACLVAVYKARIIELQK